MAYANSSGHLTAGHIRVPHTLVPPVRSWRFWVVQAGVLSVALLHDIVLVDLPRQQHGFSVNDAMTSALLAVPVIYAALNFGFRGSVATALWATVLIAPHWLFMNPLTERHLVVEVVNLAIVNAVAVIVGQRVERELNARNSAENALRSARVAEARYHSLFEDQPAPVIIATGAGTISELNSAATRLLGASAIGRSVEAALNRTMHDLVAATAPCCIPLVAPDGTERLFTPFAHRLFADDGAALVQIVLADVTEQRRRQEEQRRYATQLLKVQEDERSRLARELHDAPLQDLTYLARVLDDIGQRVQLPAEVLDLLGRSSGVAAEAASSLRKLIHGLRPPVLDDLGLVSALRQLAEELRRRSDLRIRLSVHGTERRLPPDLELTAYRTAQEALTNVLRHAHATRADVRLRYDRSLVLTIADDGRGVAEESRAQGRSGLGLLGMRERISMCGGTLEVARRPRRGTLVRATIPLTTAASMAQAG